MPDLKLYYRPTCPYCAKVMDFMKQNNIITQLKNIEENPQSKEELISDGGKSQVPCLFIDEKPLYESDDIILWLQENWKS
jgi:glutaredoxin 3